MTALPEVPSLWSHPSDKNVHQHALIHLQVVNLFRSQTAYATLPACGTCTNQTCLMHLHKPDLSDAHTTSLSHTYSSLYLMHIPLYQIFIRCTCLSDADSRSLFDTYSNLYPIHIPTVYLLHIPNVLSDVHSRLI